MTWVCYCTWTLTSHPTPPHLLWSCRKCAFMLGGKNSASKNIITPCHITIYAYALVGAPGGHRNIPRWPYKNANIDRSCERTIPKIWVVSSSPKGRPCKQIASSFQYVCIFWFLWLKSPCSKFSSYIQSGSLKAIAGVPFSPNSKYTSLPLSSHFFNKIDWVGDVQIWDSPPSSISQHHFGWDWPHHQMLPGICSTSAPWEVNLAFLSRSWPQELALSQWKMVM